MGVIGFWGTGIAHERRGQGCQDALGLGNLDGGGLVLALSDGASGSRYGAEAADANVQAVVSYFEEGSLTDFEALSPADRREQILDACRRRLAGLQQARPEAPPEDFSATLLFFVWDGRRWAAGHLGDGLLLLRDDRGGRLLYSPPEQRGRGDSTYFTIAPDAAAHLRITLASPEAPGPDLLLMMTDGPQEMFRTRGAAVEATADELLDFADGGLIRGKADLSEALDQMTVYAVDRMDDWSVVLWSGRARFQDGLPRQAVSMLELEERKQRSAYDEKTEEDPYAREETQNEPGAGPAVSG